MIFKKNFFTCDLDGATWPEVFQISTGSLSMQLL